MSEKPKTQPVPQIACTICLQEIPKSAATSEEAQDYVMHFCGLDCYAQWREPSADITLKT